MITSRQRPKGAGPAPFGLAALMFILMPAPTGHLEASAVASPAAAQPAPTRQSISAPLAAASDAAPLSLPRPIGTAMPELPPVRLASLTTTDLAVVGAIGDRSSRSRRESEAAGSRLFPTLDRTFKGDFLASLPRPDVEAEQEYQTPTWSAPDDEIEAAARFEPFPEYDLSMSLELDPHIPAEETAESPDLGQPDISLLAIANDPDPKIRTSRLFFGAVDSSLAGLVPWTPGEEPVLLPRSPDGDLGDAKIAPAPAPAAAEPNAERKEGGETVAGKGEVTGDGRHPRSPGERLGLAGKARAKAETCLANAVYFEARGESVRGQIAVAQVVLNRAFSGYYPHDVCAVVYQNAHRRLACQFTFACDGLREEVTEPAAWDRAMRIAKATLDGKIWLRELGKATHYHAHWVHPWWVRTMRKLTRIGVHSFYRPRRWGDGENAPTWGSAAATAETAAAL